MRILAEPMRRKGVFTLGDFLADRLGDPTVRRALGITTLVVLAPLLLVQLATAGRVMASVFGLPDGALTSCTVASGALMVCYSAVGGMRGTGYIQIVKVAVVLAAVTLLASTWCSPATAGTPSPSSTPPGRAAVRAAPTRAPDCSSATPSQAPWISSASS